MARFGLFISACALATAMYASEIPPGSGVPVSVLVTIEGKGDNGAPHVTPDDILVSQSKQRREVTSIEPVKQANGRQLWILMDDGLTGNFSTQINDLHQFIMAQPATTQIGIGYVRNGMVEKVQPLTSDHAAASKAIRLPTGPPGIAAEPYSALEDLIKKWPQGVAAREVLLISSGVDPIYGPGPENPYLLAAIHEAQKAGVVVDSIFYPGSGWIGHSGRQLFWGQDYLSELDQDTGGEFYWIGNRSPVTITPYLDDLDQRMNGQYLLTFLAKPESKSGLQAVRIKSELPKVKLAAPSQVYVPASK